MDEPLGFLEAETPVEAEAPAAVEEVAPEAAATIEPQPPHEPELAPQPEASSAAAPDLQSALYAQNLRFSRRFAEREYGKEAVAAVHGWAAAKCDADPAFNRAMRESDDPYEAAKQAYDREQVLSVVGPKDLDAFKAWRASQVSPPPRSLATAPGAGAAGKAHVTVGDGEAFNAAFS